MPRLKHKVPSYRHHKSSGQAIVTLNDKDFYLGQYGSEESRSEYERLIAEYLSHGRQHPLSVKTNQRGNDSASNASLTINELFVRYWNEHVVHYYVKHGKPTSEHQNIRSAFRRLLELYGDTPVDDFGPTALRAYRQRQIDDGICRSQINKRVDKIKRFFAWAGEHEIAPPMIYHRLQCVRGLKRGRSKAVETERIVPVPDAHVEAVKQLACPEVKSMIELQVLTGMRPQEVTLLRTCDLDTSGAVWWYTPSRHKTEHHDRTRKVPLGPRAQDVLRPWMRIDLEGYLFSPARVTERRNAERRANRKTPMTPSQRKRQRKRRPRKTPGEHYTTPSYGRAIAALCKKAKVPNWSPNRLRHNAATYLRKQFGLEAARTVLGHASSVVTEVYAEMDLAKAAQIMAKVG